MKKLYFAAFAYLILGLASGVFYREFTKHYAFPENSDSQLSAVHTHLLTLGFVVLLIVMVFEKVFQLSSDSRFNPFFWSYNAGLVVSAGAMVWHGMLTVTGQEEVSPALSGIAGLGHSVMSIGLILFMISLGSKVFKPAV